MSISNVGDDLKQMLSTVDIFTSPRLLFETSKILAAQIIKNAVSYTESKNANSTIVEEINKELETSIKEVKELFEKYDEDDEETEEMKQDALKLIQLTSKLYQIMEKVTPADDQTMTAFKGLVSKA